MYFVKGLSYTLAEDAGLPQWLSGKESACNAGDIRDVGSIPGSGRSPGEGNGNPLQYSCQENPMDREAWQATVHSIAESQTRQGDCAQQSTSRKYNSQVLHMPAVRVS